MATYREIKRSLIRDITPHYGKTLLVKKRPLDFNGLCRIMSDPPIIKSKVNPAGDLLC